MIKRALTLLALIGTAAPCAAAAQGLTFSARAGTLGLGGEIAVELTETLVLRGGLGLMPFEPAGTFGDLDMSLTLPTVYNVGVDLYLNDVVRVGGGMLFRRDDPEIIGDFDAAQDIGGTTFTPLELGTLTGVLDAGDRVPYALIGIGRHTAVGIGLFLDLGVVFVGDPTVRLSASGGTLSGDVDPLQSSLLQEAADIEEDLPGYLKVWPIISLGIRLGAR